MKKKSITIILSIIIIIAALSFNSTLASVLIVGFSLYILYSNLPIIFMFIGNKKYLSKNIDEAMPWYERSYKFKNSKPMIKINYAYILLKQGDIEKSEAILREVLKNDLNDRDKATANLNLSLVLWKKNNLDEAISLLEELYNNGYKTTLLYQNLGFYYIVKGNLAKALEFNLEAYEYNDSDTSILDNLAMNYYFDENYDKAIEIYEKLVPKNPSFVTTYYYYGLTLEKKAREEEAIEVLERALSYRFSFLSAVSKEEVNMEISRLKEKTNKLNSN